MSESAVPASEPTIPEYDSSPDWPFALLLVLSFLILDSVERSVQIVQGLIQGASVWPAFVLGLWVAMNTLLILLLFLRTTAGRLWTIVVFLIHMVYTGFHVIYERPHLWLSLDEIQQSRLLATLMIDALILHCMFRQDVAELLCES